ncbi:MAG: 50S ribosomal protein L11 methyltransferase [Clostridia bacterium]
MKYEKITVIIDPKDEDLATYLLFECGASGISTYNPQDDKIETGSDTFDYVDKNAFATKEQIELQKKYGNKCFLTLFFENNSGLNDFKLKAKEMLEYSFEIISENVDDTTWINEWKKFYEPFKIGKIWIVPTWNNELDLKPKIVLDPGIAFGTGQHETTSMILYGMQKYSFENKNVIDIGCGSGILGIGAIKLGAKKCHFIDIEERAVEITKKNCLSSGVEKLSTFENGYFKKNENKTYDIILANLTANILDMIKTDMFDSLNNNGLIFASGIIDGRETELEEKFLKLGFVIISKEKQNDWHSMVMRKEKR